jgi:hypothetical protein
MRTDDEEGNAVTGRLRRALVRFLWNTSLFESLLLYHKIVYMRHEPDKEFCEKGFQTL